MKESFRSIRKQYVRGRLEESLVDPDPMRQLESWLHEAIQAEVDEPTAMVLSTVGAGMRPSSRVVLMKGLDDSGLTFFTNYGSRKGLQLAENPNASLLFFWPALERQVRVEGTVEKVTEQESDEYYISRPEASRVSASISPQSREIPGRDWLLARRDDFLSSVLTSPRPSYWGGYRLKPVYFEFWQGGPDRLHDRIIYTSVSSSWEIARLAP